MTERRIEIVIAAEDDYSAAMHKFNAALGNIEGAAGRMAGGVGTAAASTDRLGRQFEKLTSASDYAISGLKRINSMITGMAFGAVIGAVSSVTSALITHYKESIATGEQAQKLNSAVMDQAKAWKLLPEPIGAVTAAQVALYNAQLNYAQFLERDSGKKLEAHVRTLEQVLRTMEESPEYAGYFGNSLEQVSLKLEEARLKLDQWRQLMNLTETSVAGVVNSMTTAAEKLAVPFGGGSLQAFVMGDLDMPKAKALGFEFGSELFGGLQDAANMLTFDLGNVIRPVFMDYAESEARFALWQETEDMMLDSHISIADRMISVEQNLQSQLTSLRFGAANHAAALLYTLGQKNKGFAMAALALQKGLAMSQVFIQSEVAAMTALTPPPFGLGPVIGAPLAASIRMWGKISMGLIAAQGIAEAAMGGGGPSGVGGGGGVGALPISAPTAPMSAETRQFQNITLIVQALDPSSVNWDRLMENNIKPALERLSGERDVALNIRVAQA